MTVTVDTNVVVRLLVDDDPVQAKAARDLFAGSDTIVIPVMALCEAVWVLSSSYRVPVEEIAVAIRAMMQAANVRIDPDAVAAGLAILDTGGDFADGVIAHDGRTRGGATFVSFDRGAVRRLAALGLAARTP